MKNSKIISEPELEIIKKAKDILHINYNKQVHLDYASRQLGVSINYLIKHFKQHTDFTPKQYIARIKIDESEKLLKQGDISNRNLIPIFILFKESLQYDCVYSTVKRY